MRVAIVAESFLPTVNGVTQSVLRIVEHLRARHHEPVIIAPHPGPGEGGRRSIERDVAAPIVWLPAVGLPGYRTFRVSPVGVGRVRAVLREVAPDVVHLAAPFLLGWDAVRAAQLLAVPSVAVYQTEVPTYATRYGFGGLEPLLWRRVCDIHSRADRTLAPSAAACAQLRERGVPEVRWWGGESTWSGSPRTGRASGCEPGSVVPVSSSWVMSAGWPPRSSWRTWPSCTVSTAYGW